MLEKDLKLSLCRSIRTAGYAKKVVSFLRDACDDLYRTGSGSIIQGVESSLDAELAVILKEVLSTFDSQKPMEIEHILRLVIEYLQGVEEINFIVPIHPDKEFSKELHDWCTQNLCDEVLLDFTTNRLMESGFLMIYKGHYFEYSLERLLDEYMVSHDMNKFFVQGGQNGQ